MAYCSMPCPAAQTHVPEQEVVLPKLECRDIVVCIILLPGLLFHSFLDAQSGLSEIFFRL